MLNAFVILADEDIAVIPDGLLMSMKKGENKLTFPIPSMEPLKYSPSKTQPLVLLLYWGFDRHEIDRVSPFLCRVFGYGAIGRHSNLHFSRKTAL
jgi:hypothetical protein